MSERDISRIGRHFLIGLRPGTSLHPKDEALLVELQPAGVVLYKSNFDHAAPYPDWLQTHEKLIDQIRTTLGRERTLIAIDHEGGRICRTPPPVTRFSCALQWAADAGFVGKTMGSELACLGVNLNFAPVLDINSNSENPVIGERAFGSDSQAVSVAAIAFMNGMHAEGVLACGKHFPGHGDTAEDSHFGLPVSSSDFESLDARELRPFSAAIAAGLPMIMTSHILFPKIDPCMPATLSASIVANLLREQMGYQGVVVSDDVGMHAMDSFFDDSRAAVKFLNAGNDMLLIAAYWTDTERARGFAEAILEAEQTGVLDLATMRESRDRIQKLLTRAPTNRVRALPVSGGLKNMRRSMLFSEDTAEVI